MKNKPTGQEEVEAVKRILNPYKRNRYGYVKAILDWHTKKQNELVEDLKSRLPSCEPKL